MKRLLSNLVMIFVFVLFQGHSLKSGLTFAGTNYNYKSAEQKTENWAKNTYNAIENLISKNSGKINAYAVFDWDNTSIFADIQEYLFIYQIDQLAFKMQPEDFKYSFLHYTDTGYEYNLQIPSRNFSSRFRNINGKQINI